MTKTELKHKIDKSKVVPTKEPRPSPGESNFSHVFIINRGIGSSRRLQQPVGGQLTRR
jgi:hypothetical protein